MLAAGLALSTPALAADAPTREEAVRFQEIAEDASGLGALREGATAVDRNSPQPPKPLSDEEVQRQRAEAVRFQEIAEDASGLGALREDDKKDK